MASEIDTSPIIEAALAAGKKVFAPKVENKAEGTMGFYQISSAACFQRRRALETGDFPALVLTPGLAFDKRGNRLGRGGGFYDRFFAELDSAGLAYTALGLCLECQLAEAVPVEEHDKGVAAILTENRYRESAAGRKA
jgi:5-formyltetrahydrofolate cyclo-ligase